MAESPRWAFPESLQPRAEETAFDLQAALDAVVQLKSEVPEDAFTAPILGTERAGNGVVIRDDGLVLTIGYLVTEAERIWLTTNRGAVVQGHVLGYDQATGFGLVLPLGRLGVAPIPRGRSDDVQTGATAYVIGHGGRAHALKAELVAKREFAGYWEYVLDEALFTAPAHPQWGGAALLAGSGRLVGIGSLLVQEALGDKEPVDGNMFVPAELLEPILGDLLRHGRSSEPPRAWLGLYATEVDGRILVGGLAPGAPAETAGLQLGDVVLEVAGERIAGLADLFRRVWAQGPAGSGVPMTVSRRGAVLQFQLRSADRNEFLKKPRVH